MFAVRLEPRVECSTVRCTALKPPCAGDPTSRARLASWMRASLRRARVDTEVRQPCLPSGPEDSDRWTPSKRSQGLGTIHRREDPIIGSFPRKISTFVGLVGLQTETTRAVEILRSTLLIGSEGLGLGTQPRCVDLLGPLPFCLSDV